MKILPLASVLLLVLVVSPCANATNDAIARAQFMIRQLNAEKSRLTSENQSLLADKKMLETKLAKLEKKINRVEEQSKQSSQSMNGKLDELKQALSQEKDAHAETRQKLDAMTSEKQRLFGIAVDQTHVIDQCVGNNHKLYEATQELLGKYKNKGIWSVIKQDEPFTGIKQVEIENLVDDYQYRLDDLRVEDPVAKVETQDGLTRNE